MRTPAIIAAAAVLVIAVSGLAAWLLWRSPRPDIEAESAKTAAPVSAAPVKAETTEAAFKPPARSVAVLAFTDMSEKKDQEYFADGLSEELIDLLTKVPDLRVPARTSSFYFKGKPAQLGEIAKALNVANVLEGSVRRAGSAVRITTHLVRVDSGYDVWSQTYDRDMKNIFQTQDEIAGAVVQALKLKLLTAGSAADRTVNIEAYSLLLRGRYLNARASEADLRNATQILQRAVALDPDYALAWSELSLSYDRLSNLYDADPVRDTEAGRAAVQRALALNPADAPAHYLLATIKVTYEHDWNGAVAEMDAARRADPNLTTPLGLVFVSGCNSGPCHEKFIRDISRDLDRDPLNAFTLSDRAYAHYYAGELEAAESDIRRSMELSPSLVDGNFLLARILVAEHKAVDALSVIQSAPDSFYRRAGLALVYQALGRKAEADAAFQDLLSKDSRDAPFQIADVFAARGNNSAALDWLQRDYDLKMYGILDAKVDPLLKPLAREPRFIALMSKLAPIQ
jgi:TolB-like protein/Flp pilus assembly protein TadD